MLVQLSQWETFRTSIRALTSSRRRKQDTTEEESTSYSSFAASIVTTVSKSSLSRLKVKSPEFNDCLPFLCITTDHHVTVLGKNLIKVDGSPSYREFSSLRYHSRPGDAGSFFARPTKWPYSSNGLPSIPAILDTKNDRVYALQQENKRLTCWNTLKNCGPDDKSALNKHLDHSALSMRLLPLSKGIIYGSCDNGAIYIARAIGESISVEYLHVKQPLGLVHVSTFAALEVDRTKTPGRKRKISDTDGDYSVNFYQIYRDGKSIKILRNNISLSISNSNRLINSESLVQNIASVDMFKDELSDYCGHHAMDRAELIVSSSGSAPKVALVYTINNTSASKSSKVENQDLCCGTFCAALSLGSGVISNIPVRLPSEANQFGLVTETILVAASTEMIYLYDLVTGSILRSDPLKYIFRDVGSDCDWLLHTNDKCGILAVLFQNEDYLHVAISTASMDKNKINAGSNALRSSSKLACSLLAHQNETPRCNISEYNQLTSSVGNKDTNSSFLMVRLDETVATALNTLEDTRCMLISKPDELRATISFREAFDASISIILKGFNSSSQDLDVRLSTGSNPRHLLSDDFRTSGRILRNGKLDVEFHTNFSTETEVRKIISNIPQSFIDGSIQIVFTILREVGNRKRNNAISKLHLDACHVLKDLIRSRRVSARFHFEGSYALQETEKEHPLYMALKAFGRSSIENPLPALEMIFEMIVNCSDLSERHLVIMLKYMMYYAKAHSIVDIFRHQDTETVSKDHILLEGQKGKGTVAGVMVVLQMIVGYSECNESMLRVALTEELSSSTEAIILARVLPKLLTKNPCSNFVRSTCQWIVALSETFRDDLSWAIDSFGESYLSLLLKSVENITKNSQAVMSLKDSIGVAELINRQKQIYGRKGLSEAQKIDEMWGYSIDHIIF